MASASGAMRASMRAERVCSWGIKWPHFPLANVRKNTGQLKIIRLTVCGKPWFWLLFDDSVWSRIGGGAMRGRFQDQGGLFSYLSPEARVPPRHPLAANQRAHSNGAEGTQRQLRKALFECIFGWGKQHGTMRKTKHRGVARVAGGFLLNLIAYNLIRIPKLVAT
jgi:Transposase DDE domain